MIEPCISFGCGTFEIHFTTRLLSHDLPGFLKDLQLGEEELTKAVIGCMGDVDAYLLPDAKGYQAMLRHLLGEDDEYRQKVRDQMLG